ncbi:MAG: hypothetical protein HY313_11840 [Acidobacteria bacterium]|nr:hypothetical protein [Acidobacteriota bacterium]
MDDTAWGDVGAPMLLDNKGDAIFIYTPPSLRSQALSRARDPRHAAKMFKRAVAEHSAAAAEGKPSRWEAFHFRSHDNPHISEAALTEISKDMTSLSYKQEILAEDVEDVPGALWTMALIDNCRVSEPRPLSRIAIGVDPAGGAGECGIIVAGVGQCPCKGKPERHGFVLQDRSLKALPDKWAREVIAAYKSYKADRIFGERTSGETWWRPR